MMRVGILGGTFNPPHIGHLILAESVRVFLRLDKVVFIPCNIPPHKSKSYLPEAYIRLKMLRLALRQCPFFEADDCEIRRQGISYTVDTLRQLKKKNPHYKLFLLIGSDLLNEFNQWKEPQAIRKLAKIVIVLRKVIKKKEKGFIFFEMPKIDISSSFIRQRIKKSKSIRYLVPRDVELYIKKLSLYRKG